MNEILEYLNKNKYDFTINHEYNEIEIIIDNIELGVPYEEDYKLTNFKKDVNFAYHQCIYSNRKEYDKIEAMIEDEIKVPYYPLSL